MHHALPCTPPAVRHLLLACGGLLLCALAQAVPVAEVVAIKGTAVVLTDGRTTALATGQALEEGQEVRSLTPGRVKLRFVDGSVVVIGDASSLRIEKFRPAGSGTPRQAGFVLDVGLISQTVTPSPEGSWTVRTPSVVTAVRGTEYIVEVGTDQQTAVSVRSGAVAVESTRAAQARRKLRVRSGLDTPEAAQPVTLEQQNAGTVCTPDGECEASKPWSNERLLEISDRLSGV